MSITRKLLAGATIATAVAGSLADTSQASVPPNGDASALADQSPIKASAAFADRAVEHGKILLSFVKDGGGFWAQFVKHKASDNSSTRPGTSVLAAFNRNMLG